MKNLLICVCFLISCATAGYTNQAFILKGDYDGYLYQDYYLAVYQEGQYVPVDSFQLDQSGKFSIPITLKEGASIIITSKEELVRKKTFLNTHPNNSIRMVYNGGNLIYKTSWRNESGYLELIEGGIDSKRIYYLSNELKKAQTKIDKLEQLMHVIATNDALTPHLQGAYADYLEAYNAKCDSIAASYTSESYMHTYVTMFKQVIPPSGLNIEQVEEWKGNHLFDYVDLQSPLVADIPLLKGMFNAYIYYNSPKGIVSTRGIENARENATKRLKAKSCDAIQKALDMQPKSRIHQLREHFIKEMDFVKIAQDKDETVWFSAINEVLAAYAEGAPFHKKFGEDAVTNFMRIKDRAVYTKFAEACISICEQFNWDEDQEQIVAFLLTDNQLLHPKGKFKQLAAFQKMRIGRKAPDLILTEHIGAFEEHNHRQTILPSAGLSEQYSLLVFHQSGCGPCEHTMASLKNNYSKLFKQGIEIISLSADTDQQVFDSTVASYPWTKKYCDFKGLQGVNFQNYAAIGTPTMYILDQQGIIQAKLGTVEEVMNWMRTLE